MKPAKHPHRRVMVRVDFLGRSHLEVMKHTRDVKRTPTSGSRCQSFSAGAMGSP